MELLYIYMENYRNVFIEQEFNFSSELRFKYDKAEGELIVEKNEIHLSDFFQEIVDLRKGIGRIVNITGIIGKNGAGKTTVLDFIKENLVKGVSGINEKAIVILRDNNERYFIHHHAELVISKGNFKEYNFEDPILYHEVANILSHRFHSILSDTTVVFYSSIFDARREYEWEGMRNISTNYLVKQLKLDALELNQIDPSFSETELFRRNEIIKQMQFINFYRENSVMPFPLPKFAFVIPKTIIDSTRNEKKLDSLSYELELEMRKWMNERVHSLTGHRQVKMRFMRTIVLNFIYEFSIYRSINLTKEFYIENGFDFSNDTNDIIMPIVQFIDITEKLVKILKNFASESLLRWINNVKKLLKLLDRCINQDNIRDGSLFTMPLFSGNSEEISIMEIVEAHFNAVNYTSHIDFDWGELSSGQKALLSLYSRFYSITEDQEKASNLILANNILILIDEGELYLHPEWQRNFLYNLIEYLPKIYKHKNIQIIFTSNSPVIISDLPKSNLIFIDRNEKRCFVIDGLVENKQTFAANIHTLFSDAFFMDKGLTGEFANQKILKLIHKINSTPSNILDREREEIELFISQIGEPVLRSKLFSMLKEKISSYLEKDLANPELMKLIQKMQREIDQLKKGKTNDTY